MAPTPGSAIFLDTNILIYASFPESIFHIVARTRLSELESHISYLLTHITADFVRYAPDISVLPLIHQTTPFYARAGEDAFTRV
jgi:predicted nucleic acid-binding protein